MTPFKLCTAVLVSLALLIFAQAVSHAADPEAEIEKLAGKPIVESFKLEYGQVKDPLVVAWVNEIGGDVAAQSPRRDLRYSFLIGDTDINNAFSVPGGTIFVTRGLLEGVDGDEELAGVLGHELGHAYRYHAAKLLASQVIFSIVDSDLVKPHGQAAQTGMLLADVLGTLAYSRNNEAEADESGVVFSSKASYDPRGLAEFFQQIGGANARESGVAELFETHPPTADRMRHVDAQIDSQLTDSDWKRIADKLRGEGLYGKAADVYARGHDAADRDAALAQAAALPPPATPAAPLADFLPDRRAQFTSTLGKARQSLKRALDTDRINSSLQDLLALSVADRDIGMLALAAQAFQTEARAQAISAEAATTTRTGEALWDALSAPAADPPASGGPLMASTAAGELGEAADAVARSVGPLRTAETTLTGAIVDLDASAFGVGFKAERTAHYGALEAALLLAGSQLDQAENRADQARADLDAAHIRVLEYQLNAYPENPVYTAIVARRLDHPAESAAPPAQFGGYGSIAIDADVFAQTRTPLSQTGPAPSAGALADGAIDSKASLSSLALILRLIDLDFQAARTSTTTGTHT